MKRVARRFSIHSIIARVESVDTIMARVESEWTGSELELEIRAGLPGEFLQSARQGGSREPETARMWVGLLGFLTSLEPMPL